MDRTAKIKVPEAGNPANPKGPWKWLPQKERTLQNRQLWGFCGVPSISAGPEAGQPANPKGLRKRSGLYEIDSFWAFVGFLPSISAVQEAGNPANPKGPWKWLPQKSGLHKTDNFWTVVGFPPFRRSQKPEIQQIRRGLGNGLLYKIDPSISAVPEAGNPANPKGPWKWLPQKERAVQNR